MATFMCIGVKEKEKKNPVDHVIPALSEEHT